MKSKFNIQKVISGCLKHDPKSQKLLVEQYSGMLYVICYRYLKNVEDARDNLQECLMRIFRYLEKFDRDKASFETWITTITIRHCLGKLAKKRLDVLPIDDLTGGAMSHYVDADILDGFDHEYLIDLIAELPENYRTVFNLAAIDGYSHKEIGELLGISVGSSRVTLNRAKSILKERVLKLKESELWVNTI